MKQILKILFVTILLSIFSCGNNDSDEDALQDWKTANEQAFNAIAANPAYKELKSPGNEGSIYYKVLTEGTGTEPIYYTNTVNVYYKGWYVVGNDNWGINKNDVFQRKEFDDGTPVSILVASPPSYLSKGSSVALQNMKKGDKWEIWIPYQLGYGTTGQYDTNTGALKIPGYSTLVFEIEVVDIL